MKVKSSEPLFAVREAKNDPSATSLDVRFSNRPFRVKHFQTIHRRMSMLLAGSCLPGDRVRCFG